MKKVFITARLPGNSAELLKREFHVDVFPEERQLHGTNY